MEEDSDDDDSDVGEQRQQLREIDCQVIQGDGSNTRRKTYIVSASSETGTPHTVEVIETVDGFGDLLQKIDELSEHSQSVCTRPSAQLDVDEPQ